jgi:hypothetical protein
MITEDMWNNFLATEFEVTMPDCNCGCGTKAYTLKVTPEQMWDKYMKAVDMVGLFKAYEEGVSEYQGVVGGAVIKAVKVAN